MADKLSKNTYDNEAGKFFGDINDKATVRVGGLGGLLEGVQYDTILASYPNTTTEIYTYNLNTVTQATVTVIYTNASKDDLVSVVRS